MMIYDSKITNTSGKNIFAFCDFAKHFINNSHVKLKKKIMEPNEKRKKRVKKPKVLIGGGSVGDNVCYERLLRKEKIALKSAEKLGNRLN